MLKKVTAGILALVLLTLVLVVVGSTCVSAWFRYGILTDRCPVGDLVPAASLQASQLRRGGVEGYVHIGAHAIFSTALPDEARWAEAPIGDAELVLVRGDTGAARIPLTPKRERGGEQGWNDHGRHGWSGFVALPTDLPDGDHTLEVKVRSRTGEAVATAPLAVYAPARVHVITDRPLYEPGNTIQFRAVVLRARDLVPLEGRQGRFIVTDAEGTVVLEERAPAGPWGVASGEIPLDGGAPVGTWRVRWESADASDEVAVQVEPFTLPRFTVELSSVSPFYLPGQRPRLLGEVKYTSGAPVVADVTLRWSSQGAWPPPSSWLERDLPQEAKTDASGRFELLLPPVPADLLEQATLVADVTAVDPTGDQARAGASVLLSKDAIRASAVTELGGGRLLEGFNNRLYLRVTTAAGRPLAGARTRVARAWDPGDRGEEVRTDEDGVAALQIDPGPPVTVLVPQQPVRPPPPIDPIERNQVVDLVRGSSPPLAEVLALDSWNRDLAGCARFVSSDSLYVEVTLEVLPTGAVASVVGEGPAQDCFRSVVERKRLPRGDLRLLQLGYTLRSDLPSFHRQDGGTGTFPAELADDVDRALLDARRCLPGGIGHTNAPRMLVWHVEGKRFTGRFADDPQVRRGRLPASAARCLESTLAGFARPRTLEGGDASGIGIVRFTTRPGPRANSVRASGPTTRLGYELLVSAFADDEALGKTRLVLSPGQVPPLRLRATPVLAEAGGKLVVEVLRGPGFRGSLPKALVLSHEQGPLEAPLDLDTRQATFTLPPGRDGWYEARLQNAVARAYVRPLKELSVEVAPDRPVYTPGATARIGVTTRAAGKATEAAVGLIGVDETLSVLVPLPGPDDMARLLPEVAMQSRAFGALEAQALVQGRIRGEHAAAATVLLVSAVPTPPELDVQVSTAGQTAFDPLAPLVDNFYGVLGELHGEVRAWEASAPTGQVMHPATMVELWERALTARDAKGAPVTDAYGRRLALAVLPQDLLELTAPRVVVVDGKRLPEDVEDWATWVRRNAR